ncbi:hypothetical protein AK812_SmicGene14552 [Symbiodinium microadriaticum]|uniref:Uncharacterized protein n=1 Tax=Symbiodinium microadriaticum TaxID=2951 RepID=A0A1Q9E569_SYMMI|nr:hypothetical protein AK812_SmicGene14552 [Symbiodinium microadriaticum]
MRTAPQRQRSDTFIGYGKDAHGTALIRAEGSRSDPAVICSGANGDTVRQGEQCVRLIDFLMKGKEGGQQGIPYKIGLAGGTEPDRKFIEHGDNERSTIRDAYNPTARNREELAITVQQIGLDEGTNFTCLSNNSIFNQGVYFVCDPGPMEEIDRIPRAIRLFEALNISCLSGNVGRHSADVAMTNRSWNKEKAAFWFVLRLGACAMATRNASGQIISVDWQQEQDPQGERSQKFRCWCATFTMSNTCSRAKLPDCGKSFNLNLLISARDSTTWNGSLLDPLGPQ